jgi:acyl-CoA reductase-like NAD-dependent aldehyde dehydrogenase
MTDHYKFVTGLTADGYRPMPGPIARRSPLTSTTPCCASSLTSAWFMAENIDRGTVDVNETTNYWELLVLFGGMKKSGVGRVLGTASMDAFTNQKQITFSVG